MELEVPVTESPMYKGKKKVPNTSNCYERIEKIKIGSQNLKLVLLYYD